MRHVSYCVICVVISNPKKNVKGILCCLEAIHLQPSRETKSEGFKIEKKEINNAQKLCLKHYKQFTDLIRNDAVDDLIKLCNDYERERKNPSSEKLKYPDDFSKQLAQVIVNYTQREEGSNPDKIEKDKLRMMKILQGISPELRNEVFDMIGIPKYKKTFR